MLHLTPDFETLRLTCDFKTFQTDARQTQLFKILRQTPARGQPDITFRNQASGARFQNHAPDVIFCDHVHDVSDVHYESGYVCHYQTLCLSSCIFQGVTPCRDHERCVRVDQSQIVCDCTPTNCECPPPFESKCVPLGPVSQGVFYNRCN